TDSNGKSVFLGNQTLTGGTFVGGGFGLRAVIRLDCNLRFSGELAVSGGRFAGVDGWPYQAESSAILYSLLVGLGYEWNLGSRVVIHTATMSGLAGADFDVTQPRVPVITLAATNGGLTAASSNGSVHLSRMDFRLGQQVGLHV